MNAQIAGELLLDALEARLDLSDEAARGWGRENTVVETETARQARARNLGARSHHASLQGADPCEIRPWADLSGRDVHPEDGVRRHSGLAALCSATRPKVRLR